MKSEKLPTTKEVFEGIYKRPLSKEELFLIERNFVSFFNLLIKIEKKVEKGILK